MPPRNKKFNKRLNNGSKNIPREPWNKKRLSGAQQRRFKKKRLLQAMSDEINNFGDDDYISFPFPGPPKRKNMFPGCSRSPFYHPKHSKKSERYFENDNHSYHPRGCMNRNNTPRSPFEYSSEERDTHFREGHDNFDNEDYYFDNDDDNHTYNSSEHRNMDNWGPFSRPRSPFDYHRHSRGRNRHFRDSHRPPFDEEISNHSCSPPGHQNRSNRNHFRRSRSPIDNQRSSRDRDRLFKDDEIINIGDDNHSFGSRGRNRCPRSPFDYPGYLGSREGYFRDDCRSSNRDFSERHQSPFDHRRLYTVNEHFHEPNMTHFDPRHRKRREFLPQNFHEESFSERHRPYEYRFLDRSRSRSYDSNLPSPRRDVNDRDEHFMQPNEPFFDSRRSRSISSDPRGDLQAPRRSRESSFSPGKDHREYSEHNSLYYYEQESNDGETHFSFANQGSPKHYDPYREEDYCSRNPSPYYNEERAFGDLNALEHSQYSPNHSLKSPQFNDRPISPTERRLLDPKEDFERSNKALVHRRPDQKSFEGTEGSRDVKENYGASISPKRILLECKQDFESSKATLGHQRPVQRSFVSAKGSVDVEDYGAFSDNLENQKKVLDLINEGPIDSAFENFNIKLNFKDYNHPNLKITTNFTASSANQEYVDPKNASLDDTSTDPKSAQYDSYFKKVKEILSQESEDNYGHFSAQMSTLSDTNDPKNSYVRVSQEASPLRDHKSPYESWKQSFSAKNLSMKHSKPTKHAPFWTYSCGIRKEEPYEGNFVQEQYFKNKTEAHFIKDTSPVASYSSYTGIRQENLDSSEHNLKKYSSATENKLADISERPRLSGAAKKKLKQREQIKEMKEKFGKVFFETTGAPDDYFEKIVRNANDVGWGGKKNRFGALINKKESKYIIVPIIWDTYPNKKINNLQAEIIKECLITKISEAENDKPRFHSLTLDNGALLAFCIDKETVQWLEKTIPTCPNIGKNFLQAAKMSEIHMAKVMVYVPGLHISGKEFLARLENQNPDFVDIKNWKVLSGDSLTENESRYILQMSIDCWNKLLKRNKTLFYHFTYLKFMILYKNKKDKQRMKELFKEARSEKVQRNNTEHNYGVTKMPPKFQMTTRSMKRGENMPGALKREQSTSGTRSGALFGTQSSLVSKNIDTRGSFELQGSSLETFGVPSTSGTQRSAYGSSETQSSTYGSSRIQSAMKTKGFTPGSLNPQSSTLRNFGARSNVPSTVGAHSSGYGSSGTQSGSFSTYQEQSSTSFGTLGIQNAMRTKSIATSGSLELQNIPLGTFGARNNAPRTSETQSGSFTGYGGQTSASYGTSLLGTAPGSLKTQGASLRYFGTYSTSFGTSGTQSTSQSTLRRESYVPVGKFRVQNFENSGPSTEELFEVFDL